MGDWQDAEVRVGQIAQATTGRMPYARAGGGPKLAAMSKPLPLLIRLWFLADAVLALTPQLHHLASDGAPILGVPRVLAYLFGVSAFISASVVAAYFADPARHAR